MIKVVVCIGSSCHLKGSRQIVERLQYLVKAKDLEEKVELSGAFCMGKCNSEGVSVTVDGEFVAVNPDEVDAFFDDKVVAKVNAKA